MRAATLFALLFLSTLTSAGQVPGGPPLRHARSDDGRFVLRIEPGRAGRGDGSTARGTLLERGRGGQPAKVWEAPLVNAVAPVHAFVRNDGRFVVTLDEYRRGGARHALVVYGEKGAVLREFELRELLAGGDWQRVRVRADAVLWLPGARFEFVDRSEQFRIRLKWGREIRVDLSALQVVREPDESAEADAGIPPEVLEALSREVADPSEDGAVIRDEQVNRLRELHELLLQRLEMLRQTEDPSPQKEQFLLQGLARLEEQLAQLESAEENPDVALDAPLPGDAAAAEDAGGLPSAPRAVLRAPAPNPAAPVDYVAWVNEQTRTAGPGAAPLILSAVALHVDYTGPTDLLTAALAGDSEALYSPEITEWLEANREAIDTLRQARDLEYCGLTTLTDSELLLEVQLPHISALRQLSRGILLEGKRLESEGQLEQAAAAYADVLAIGAQVGQGPTLIENLVGMSIQARASEILLDAFASDGDRTVDYAAIQDLLDDSYRPLRPISETLEFERACLLDLVQFGYELNPETGQYRVSEAGVAAIASAMGAGEDHPVSQTAVAMWLSSIGFERMVADVNRHYDRMAEAMTLPYSEGSEVMNDIEEELRNPIRRLTNPVMAVMLPALSNANFLATRAEANRRATTVVTGLRAYQQQHGRLPDSLEAFGDHQAGIDPFTGQYFHYRREGDDFVLYSAAGNGTDDGGTHDPRGRNGDLLYWPRPGKQQPTK